MSFFLRKFDHNDINSYLPLNKTIGTFQYYKNKFGDKFPDWKYEIWEAQSLLEGEESKERVQKILLNKKEYEQKLLNEFETRFKENLSINNIEDNDTINNISNDTLITNIPEQ